MVKHNQTIRRQFASSLNVFDHFVGLALKELRCSTSSFETNENESVYTLKYRSILFLSVVVIRAQILSSSKDSKLLSWTDFIFLIDTDSGVLVLFYCARPMKHVFSSTFSAKKALQLPAFLSSN